jgi:hypothetical protein
MKVFLDRVIGPACLAGAAYNICDQIHMSVSGSIMTTILVFVGFATMEKS